jgi:hypothetical protein
MTQAEIEAAWLLVNKYGPPNSWTASNGTLAAALGRALEHIEGETMTSNGSEILLEAHALVNGDRGNEYGHPADDYAKVRDIFAALTGIDLSVEQAVLFPLAMKLARIRTNMEARGFHRDSVIDGAGYLACLSMIRERAAQTVQ